jgi:hypothetical protein
MMPSRLGMALLLISTAIPLAAGERTLQEQARKIHRGSKVLVQMNNHNTVVGRLVDVTQTNLTLALGPTGASRSIFPFQDLSNIRHIREMPKSVEAIATIPVMLICGLHGFSISMPAVTCRTGVARHAISGRPTRAMLW